MFIVTQNDNSDARLARLEAAQQALTERLEQQIAELRAEIAALKAEQQPTDRKAYMRDYMRRKRAAERGEQQQ
jgi:hypothetical protein